MYDLMVTVVTTYLDPIHCIRRAPVWTYAFHSLAADTHMDASTDAFRESYTSDAATRPDWVVTSPPYSNAFAILKQALCVARVGVAFKMRLSFLEPTPSRVDWLRSNPPSRVIVLPRAIYRGRTSGGVEAWFVWEEGAALQQGQPARQVGFASP